MTDIDDIRSRMHGLTEQECPELTPRQELAEPRRRAVKAMIGACDEIEASVTEFGCVRV